MCMFSFRGRNTRLLFICMGIGYLVGAFVFVFAPLFSDSFLHFTPIFPSSDGIRPFFVHLCKQISWFVAVWICGLCKYRTPFPLCLPLLVLRSFLGGLSAAALLLSDLPVAAYFVHTCISAILLLLLYSLGNVCSDDGFIRYGKLLLFFSGTAILFLLLFWFLLLIWI